MTSDIYRVQPVGQIDGIDTFISDTSYTSNYEQISIDHLTELQRSGISPFMSDDLVSELHQSALEALASFVTEDSCVVDLGCGMGEILAALPARRLYGVDISIPYLKHAKEHGVAVCKAFLEDLPYKDAMFDAVICTDVLEHVVGFDRAMSEIRRILKPGGKAFIRVPFEENLSWYASDDCPYEFVHLRRFDIPTLMLAVKKMAFLDHEKTIFTGYVPGVDNLRIWSPHHLLSVVLAKMVRVLSGVVPRVADRVSRAIYKPVFVAMLIARPK